LGAKYSGPPQPESEVAKLGGYVQIVDDRDVSDLGNTFELLPGCHIVQTPTQWGHTELNIGGVSWTTGHITYFMPMKANHSYQIKVEGHAKDGTHHWGTVTATETDSQGTLIRTFFPVNPATVQCPKN